MNEHKNRSEKDQSDSSEKDRREIGEGMHSLDSTQAPLKTSDGLPDYRAMTGGKEPSARDSEKDEESK